MRLPVATTTSTKPWLCETCQSTNQPHHHTCELCNTKKPFPTIPIVVVFCLGISMLKFSVTALLPFYGSLPPRDASTLRTFLVADALSFENLAHCGLTSFLSVLWWLTGVDFFGDGLLVVLLLLWVAALGELIVAAVSLQYQTLATAYSMELHGPIVL